MEDELVIKTYWAVSKAAVAVAEWLPFGKEPYLELEELMLKLCISYCVHEPRHSDTQTANMHNTDSQWEGPGFGPGIGSGFFLCRVCVLYLCWCEFPSVVQKDTL